MYDGNESKSNPENVNYGFNRGQLACPHSARLPVSHPELRISIPRPAEIFGELINLRLTPLASEKSCKMGSFSKPCFPTSQGQTLASVGKDSL